MNNSLRLIGFAASLFLCVPVQAAEELYLPCDGAPDPAHATLGERPNLRVITKEGFVWDAPRCIGWGKGKYALLIAVAGRFEHKGGEAALVRKFARISRLKTVRYWSTSAQAWRNLFRNAHALSRPQQGAVRVDFDVADFVPGPVRHLWLTEQGPIGGAMFRMRTIERTRDRIIIDLRNERPIRPPEHPKISAGGYRYVFILDREGPGVWRYYGVTGLRGAGGGAITWIRGSYLNRAIAMYQYIAGLPMEREPPAAR